MTQKCYCDWTLVWWWFRIFGSDSDSDTTEIFRIGSDHQISISAQHCLVVVCTGHWSF